MKQFIITITVICIVSGLRGQSVTLDISTKSNTSFWLIAKKGLRNDTLAKGILDASGKYMFTPSKTYLQGIWTLSFASGNTMDFVWTGNENMIIAENNIIRNSPENERINGWMQQKLLLDSKLHLCEAGMQLYTGDKTKQAFFTSEKNTVKNALTKFEKSLQLSKSYSAKYIGFQSMLEEYQPLLSQPKQDKSVSEKFHSYFVDSLDVASLYTSGLWFNVINTALELYRTGDSSKQQGFYRNDFTTDMIYLLARTEQPEAFLMLGNDLLLICEQFGWDEPRNGLLNYLSSSVRITTPTPLMKRLFEIKMTKVGQVAPEIMLANNQPLSKIPANEYIVMFFETGCGHCETEITLLKKHYEELKAKNIAVLTISADTDKMIYGTTSNMFAWQKKCDYKGFQGTDFKNYGVVGTPTFFVIDKNGKIIGTYASLEQTHLVEN